MPPMAAAIGSAARVGSRRSPATNSRLSSSPTTKKKIANRPSAAHADTDNRRCSDSGPIANSETARYAADHGELAHSRAAPAATNNSTPPTVSFRRIWANRCDSDHEPRVRSRKLAGIGRSLVILAERLIGLPGFAIYGIFTGGAPGSLVGSRTAGDDSRRRTGSSSVAMQPTFGPVGGRQDTVWISPDAHDRDVPLRSAGRTDRRGVSRRHTGLQCARRGAVAGDPAAA